MLPRASDALLAFSYSTMNVRDCTLPCKVLVHARSGGGRLRETLASDVVVAEVQRESLAM